jgi:hypothetical protein
MVQGGCKSLEAKCGKSGEGISLLCPFAGRHGSILQFENPALSKASVFSPRSALASPVADVAWAAEASYFRLALKSLG